MEPTISESIKNVVDRVNQLPESERKNVLSESLQRALAISEAMDQEIVAEPTTADEFNNPETNEDGQSGELEQGTEVDANEGGEATGTLQADGGSGSADTEAAQD